MSTQTQQLALMLVIGIIIGTAIVMVGKTSMTEDGDVASQGATTTDMTEEGGVKMLPDLFTGAQVLAPQIPANERLGLVVRDQERGNSVHVSGLDVSGSKWVAVYDDRDGKPGWILGAARVREGDKDATIPLLRPEGTTVGATYYVAILNDDGDDEFNRLADLPPFSSENVVVVSFKAL